MMATKQNFKIEFTDPKVQTFSYPTRAAAMKDAKDYSRLDAVGTAFENVSKRGAPKWEQIFWFDSTGVYKAGGHGREIDRLENPTPTKAQLQARKLFAQRAKAGTLKAPAKRAPAKKSARAKMNPATRDDSIPGDFSQSSVKVLGRAWSDAENASVKEYGDGESVVRLTYKDGEWLQMIFDTKAGALKTLTRLGFIA